MLFEIAESVRARIEKQKRNGWEKEVLARLDEQQVPREFSTALQGDDLKFILEIKRTSPTTKGQPLAFDVAEIAAQYEACGASAVSVLTEENYFGGSLCDLVTVRSSVDLPLLRKDFVVDKLQIAEAKAFGADAVLLIVALLTERLLREFLDYSREIALAALVEAHTYAELQRAVNAGAEIIGVNNRNLQTMHIDLQKGADLLRMVPDHCTRVAESGIRTRSDVLLMQDSGADALLVGSSVVRSTNIEQKIKELMGR